MNLHYNKFNYFEIIIKSKKMLNQTEKKIFYLNDFPVKKFIYIKEKNNKNNIFKIYNNKIKYYLNKKRL